MDLVSRILNVELPTNGKQNDEMELLSDKNRTGVSVPPSLGSNKKEDNSAPLHSELLKGLLSQVSINNSDLHKQLLALVQQQSNSKDTHQEQEKIKESKEDVGDGVIGSELSGSAHGNVEEISKEFHTPSSMKNNSGYIDRGNIQTESPDHESEGWIPSKIRKISAEENGNQSATEESMKKARDSIRAQSEAAMMIEGSEGRKHGQNLEKENPYPQTPDQVEDCADDQSLSPTTDEGNHNHPFTPSSPDGLLNRNISAKVVSPSSPSMTTAPTSVPLPAHTSSPLPLQTPAAQFRLSFPNLVPQAVASPALLPILQVFSKSLHQQITSQPALQAEQHSLANVLSAATTAVTADPDFITALASAISSTAASAQATTSTNITIKWTNANNNSCNTNSENTENTAELQVT